MYNAKDLMDWAEIKKADLEEKGRTNGEQYRTVLEWSTIAEKLQEIPAEYIAAPINENGITDPRTWASRVLEADAPIRAFVKFGQPLDEFL